MILPKTYIPSHKENRMQNEGRTEEARQSFFQNKPNNLSFLLNKRYKWMLPYIRSKNSIFELGAGPGFSKAILNTPNISLTDINKYPWIDREVDALNLPFKPNSVDVFICSHMIHHVAYPSLFLKNLTTALKPEGLILINEINTSFLLKIILRIMKHEGWDYEKDVFDEKTPSNSSSYPWSANCAIPEMLWQNKIKFETTFKGLTVKKDEFCEFFIFLLSGGVIAKTKTINLPMPILKAVDILDRMLIKTSPNIFALSRKLVLQKVGQKSEK